MPNLKQAGVKLAGSIAALFSAEATHRQHNAQTESLVLRVDYEHEPDVRGIELWEIYCVQEHSFELLGLCLLVRWGVHAPRWTSIVTHTAESLPRIEYLGGHLAHGTAHANANANAGLADRIEAQIRSGGQGELTHEPAHTRASLLSTSKLPRSFPELARYQKQSERLSAGRFRFWRDVEVVTSLYPQAEIEAVQRLPDLLQALNDERRLLLQLGNHVGRVALCESEQEWEEARAKQRDQLYTLSQLAGASRLRVGFSDRLATRLQRQNIRDFGLLDKRTIIVFAARAPKPAATSPPSAPTWRFIATSSKRCGLPASASRCSPSRAVLACRRPAALSAALERHIACGSHY